MLVAQAKTYTRIFIRVIPSLVLLSYHNPSFSTTMSSDKLPAGLSSSSDDDDYNDEEVNNSVASSSDDDDDNDDNDSDNNESKMKSSLSKKRKIKTKSSKTKKQRIDNINSNNNANKSSSNFIDDAAILSGSDDSDDDDDYDSDNDSKNDNDYIKDDFVVDDDEKDKKDDDGLMDSDDSDDSSSDDDSDDSDSDEDDSDDEANSQDGDTDKKKRKKKKRKKMKRVGRMQDQLAQEDLDLIEESKGIHRKKDKDGTNADDIHSDDEEYGEERRKPTKIDDLRNELFIDDGDDDQEADAAKKNEKRKMAAPDAFDEEGMDDFIDDDGDDVGMRGRYRDDLDEDPLGPGEGVSEAQINEANDIFGTDFLEFMAEENGDGDDDFDNDDDDMFDDDDKRKFRERGVGVDLGIDSDEDDVELSDDDEEDDDLFGDDADDEGGRTSEQRAEALRLKREKRRLQKEERRKKKSEARKARLRRAFEPVQLIENFCTDRDDEIRSMDVPERFFDWKTPFHGPIGDISSITLAEEREAMWIVKRIPDIASEYAHAEMESLSSTTDNMEESERKTFAIIESIIKALRLMHREKLEPEFIRKYRADEVTSPAVRDNLYHIMDEDAEWDRLIIAKSKVEKLLQTINDKAQSYDALKVDDEYIAKLREDLKIAQDRLDESVRDEEKKKAEIVAMDQNDNDDDDDLFGDDDDDDDDEKKAVSHRCYQFYYLCFQDEAKNLNNFIAGQEEAKRFLAFSS